MNENNKQLNTNGNLKTVRTYLSDMADTVRQNEISVIKVALAEQNKNERENIYRQEEGTPIKKVMWFIGGAVLIIGSIVGVYFLLNQKTKNTPAQITKEETVISYDETSSINTTDQLTERINSVKKEVGANGSIKFISLSQTVSGVEEKLSVKDLFSSLKFSASPSLIRALSDSYMVGTYTIH